MAAIAKTLVKLRADFRGALDRSNTEIDDTTADTWIERGLRMVNDDTRTGSPYSVNGTLGAASAEVEPVFPDDANYNAALKASLIQYHLPILVRTSQVAMVTNTVAGRKDLTALYQAILAVFNLLWKEYQDKIQVITSRNKAIVPKAVNLATANPYRRFYSEEPNLAGFREGTTAVVNMLEDSSYVYRNNRWEPLNPNPN